MVVFIQFFFCLLKIRSLEATAAAGTTDTTTPFWFRPFRGPHGREKRDQFSSTFSRPLRGQRQDFSRQAWRWVFFICLYVCLRVFHAPNYLKHPSLSLSRFLAERCPWLDEFKGLLGSAREQCRVIEQFGLLADRFQHLLTLASFRTIHHLPRLEGHSEKGKGVKRHKNCIIS